MKQRIVAMLFVACLSANANQEYVITTDEYGQIKVVETPPRYLDGSKENTSLEPIRIRSWEEAMSIIKNNSKLISTYANIKEPTVRERGDRYYIECKGNCWVGNFKSSPDFAKAKHEAVLLIEWQDGKYMLSVNFKSDISAHGDFRKCVCSSSSNKEHFEMWSACPDGMSASYRGNAFALINEMYGDNEFTVFLVLADERGAMATFKDVRGPIQELTNRLKVATGMR